MAIHNGNNNISNSTTALVFGGESYPGGATVATTEEWSFPSGPSFLIEGQMWYNSSTGNLKAYGKDAGIPAGTWASGAALNTGRNRAGTSASSNSSALFFGGSVPPSTYKDLTEKYNGTAWTEVNEMNTGRR